jgi:hypothetical protein
MKSQFDEIAKRRAAVRERRLHLREKMSEIQGEDMALAREDGELETALRVLMRLFPSSSGSTSSEKRQTIHDEEVAIPKRGSPRPMGIPTTRKMIHLLLAEAKGAGLVGLSGRQLVLAINDRWWPGVGSNDIIPDAYRLVRSGDLTRQGPLFVRSVGPDTRENKKEGSMFQ